MSHTPRSAKHPVNGLLVLDKPSGPTSNGVLQRVKRLYGAAKAGHAGTLDPMATGLLAICFGEGTKYASGLLEGEKSYSGIIRLGVVTDTGDAEGSVVERHDVDVAAIDISRIVQLFSGEVTQIPPNYSAIKVNGRPLYAYAREGKPVAAQPRVVRIHALHLQCLPPEDLRFSVTCSSGTYVRSLAEDIGRAIGCGGHLAALRRTASGPLNVDEGSTFELLESLDHAGRLSRLLPPDAPLFALPALILDSAAVLALLRGQVVDAPSGASVGKSKVYDQSMHFLGVAEVTAEGRLAPVRLMAVAQATSHTENVR
ncbi:MAG: tRNA pseudouridine(55) synthase TruB [Betaproteobacteria bacterium]